jgi:PPOX class probable F420-dependent enzyme
MPPARPTPLPKQLSPAARDFLDALRFAVVATLNEDGSPHQAVAWYTVEADGILVNSAEGRRWPANLRRDPRVEVTVTDGYRYVQLGGAVEVDDDQGRAQAAIAAMARRYHAADPAHAEDLIANRFRPQRRVSFRLRPTAIRQDL